MTLFTWEEESITVSCSPMRHHIITDGRMLILIPSSRRVHRDPVSQEQLRWMDSIRQKAMGGVCRDVMLSWRCREGRKSCWSQEGCEPQHAGWLINQGWVLKEGSCSQSLDNETQDIISYHTLSVLMRRTCHYPIHIYTTPRIYTA